MPRNKSEELALQQRRKQVAEMYLRGQTQWQIAHQMGVNQAQISRDLKVIRREWLNSAVQDFDARKAQELAKIDAVEAEAWTAWKRSQEPSEVVKASTDGSGVGRQAQAAVPVLIEALESGEESARAIKGASCAGARPARLVFSDLVSRALIIEIVPYRGNRFGGNRSPDISTSSRAHLFPERRLGGPWAWLCLLVLSGFLSGRL
jgi:hypothetical protein